MKTFAAAILSLLVPGAGQAFNGNRAKSIAFGAAYGLWPAVSDLLFRVDAKAETLLLLIALSYYGYNVIQLISCLDAASDANRLRKGILPWSRAVPAALLTAGLVWGIQYGMLSSPVFELLSGHVEGQQSPPSRKRAQPAFSLDAHAAGVASETLLVRR